MDSGKCLVMVGCRDSFNYYSVAGLALLLAAVILTSGFVGYTGSELKCEITRDMRTVTITNMSDRAQEDITLRAYGLDIRGREVWASSPIKIRFLGGGQSVEVEVRIPDRFWRIRVKEIRR